MAVFADLISILLQSITTICVTVLATMGISLIFKTSNTTNFAQGSIAALGCYFAYYLFKGWGLNIPFWISVILSIFIGVGLGLLIDIGIFRRGKNVNAVGKQIITMGMVTLIVGVIPIVFGTDEGMRLDNFISGSVVFTVFGKEVSVTNHALICLAITVVVIGVLFLLLYKSKWGLGVRATASNESTAGIIGINTYIITATSWAIAAGLGVLAAVMFASETATINSYFMTEIQVNSFLSGILGGFSTFYGPIVGAVLIPVFTAIVGWGGVYVDFFQKFSIAIVYSVLLIAVLIKPQGLFGKKIIKKV
jgi:branched-chain amino acid transport system permease protein